MPYLRDKHTHHYCVLRSRRAVDQHLNPGWVQIVILRWPCVASQSSQAVHWVQPDTRSALHREATRRDCAAAIASRGAGRPYAACTCPRRHLSARVCEQGRGRRARSFSAMCALTQGRREAPHGRQIALRARTPAVQTRDLLELYGQRHLIELLQRNRDGGCNYRQGRIRRPHVDRRAVDPTRKQGSW